MYTYLHVHKNLVGFIFLGDMGGIGVWGGLGDKETGCRYQQVHKQPFRLYLFRGHGGDLGLGGVDGRVDGSNILSQRFKDQTPA